MIRRTLLTLALLSLALLACAGTALAKTPVPVVTKISPLSVKVGQKLTIYGKSFVAGKGKTKVFFLRANNKGAVWVRADKASAKKIVVTVPASLRRLIPASGKATRFQIRVLGKSFGKTSRASRSPLIAAEPAVSVNAPASGSAGAGGAGGAGGASGATAPAVVGSTTPAAGCTPNYANPASDVDGDLLSDKTEQDIGTDPCAKDSDADGAPDGYEYYSSKDLNSNALPYPWKMPYPNALSPDADVDYDGDGLYLGDESALWVKFGNSQLPLNYSDGTQTTVATPAPADPLTDWSLDLDGDGQLNDGERDADGDGLSNWDESHGRMTHDWWTAAYDGTNGPKETDYTVTFAGTNMLDADTDGDTRVDGQDDNDFDGYSNMFELRRPSNWGVTYVSLASNWTPGAPGTLAPGADPYARVQPFNPCKPLWSAICHQHYPFGYYQPSEDWAAPTQAEITAAGGPAAPSTLP